MATDGDQRLDCRTERVTLVFRGVPDRLRHSSLEKRSLALFAEKLRTSAGQGCTFTCLIASDKELRRLNRLFLNHDYATDVLSFPSGEQDGDLGEIAISIDRADAQANQFGHSRQDEVCILMLHGFLHLTGMDHERDRGEMARAERKWRTVLGLPSGLIARSRQSRSAPLRRVASQ